jgi:hypothetical protein
VLVLLLITSTAPPVLSGLDATAGTSQASNFAVQLVNPQTIQLGTGETQTQLDRTRDYIIKLPAGEKRGYTLIDGGRNVLIDGGSIAISGTGSDLQRRAIYIKNATGTVRVEDVSIRGSTSTAAFDAVAIAAPLAVVELVNLNVSNLHGRMSGYHGDIVQPFGGVKKLIVNGLTGQTAYQGFYLAETGGKIGGVDLRNVRLSYLPNPYDASTVMIWFDGCSTYPVTMQNVSIQPRPGQNVARSVRPNGSGCKPTSNGSIWSWPASSSIDGTITQGSSATGGSEPDKSRRVDGAPPAVRVAVAGSVRAGSRVKLAARVKDGAAVKSVAFGVCKGTRCSWATARKLGKDASQPFATTWKAPKRGTYTFLARATDANGEVTISPAKKVKVKAVKNQKQAKKKGQKQNRKPKR